MIEKKICVIEGCDKPSNARGWCKTHYGRWIRHGDPVNGFAKKPSPEERFWAKVSKDPNHPKGCWLWTGYTFCEGYGQFALNGGAKVTHRYSYELANNVTLAKHDQIHHTCANRGCVNPKHLQHVSARENMAEMQQRTYYLARIKELENQVWELGGAPRAV